MASLRNKALMLKPAFALLSINIIPSLLALSSPSSTDTCRFSERSVLFPTKIIITSFPRSFLTSSIHFEVLRNEARSTQLKLDQEEIGNGTLLVISNTTTATEESLIYDGIRDRNLSCPAVSQSCNRTVLSSRYMVLDKKSIPMVA